MAEEADFSMTDMAFSRAATPGTTRPGDENLLVRFFQKPRQNAAKTEAEGRPIFEDVDYIEIRIPGARDVAYCQPVTQIDRDRFPEHWRLYKARMQAEVVQGTPLAEWPQISRSLAEELKFLHITTVEQLANVSDANIQRIMGGHGLKAKAKAFLESGTELESTRQQLAAQEALNKQLLARLEALENAGAQTGDEPVPRRRGRPPLVSVPGQE